MLLTQTCFLALLGVLGGSGVPAVPELNWEKTSEKKGFILYKAEAPGTSLLAFGGETVIPVGILKVAHVVRDPSRGPEWIPDLAESRILERTEGLDFYEYDWVRMPFPVHDRDIVSLVTTELHPEAGRILVRFVSTELASAPPHKGRVRANILFTDFILSSQPDGGTRVEGRLLGDPRGHLPHWLVNFFQKGWAKSTLKHLKEQCMKEDVTEDPDLVPLWKPVPSARP